jgi:hypothetical protein
VSANQSSTMNNPSSTSSQTSSVDQSSTTK